MRRKGARPVLRGRGGSNTSSLPDLCNAAGGVLAATLQRRVRALSAASAFPGGEQRGVSKAERQKGQPLSQGQAELALLALYY